MCLALNEAETEVRHLGHEPFNPFNPFHLSDLVEKGDVGMVRREGCGNREVKEKKEEEKRRGRQTALYPII